MVPRDAAASKPLQDRPKQKNQRGLRVSQRLPQGSMSLPNDVFFVSHSMKLLHCKRQPFVPPRKGSGENLHYQWLSSLSVGPSVLETSVSRLSPQGLNSSEQRGWPKVKMNVHGGFNVRIRVNDPSAGSPTETLLRLLLPLNDQV